MEHDRPDAAAPNDAAAGALDHREINRDLAVFVTDPLAGSGLPLWLPGGAVIRRELECLAADLASGTVQVTDVAAGFRGTVARSRLVGLAQAAYLSRAALVDWAAGA